MKVTGLFLVMLISIGVAETMDMTSDVSVWHILLLAIAAFAVERLYTAFVLKERPGGAGNISSSNAKSPGLTHRTDQPKLDESGVLASLSEALETISYRKRAIPAGDLGQRNVSLFCF